MKDWKWVEELNPEGATCPSYNPSFIMIIPRGFELSQQHLEQERSTTAGKAFLEWNPSDDVDREATNQDQLYQIGPDRYVPFVVLVGLPENLDPS